MVNEIKNYSCCIIGHRKINATNDFVEKVKSELKELIVNKHVIRFLFGSNGEFNDLCYKVVNELKQDFPYIKTIFYSRYDEIAFTFEEKEQYDYKSKTKPFPYKCFDEIIENEQVHKYSGKYSYVLRNKILIQESGICLFYFKDDYRLPNIGDKKRNSGTKIAYNFAKQEGKYIVNLALLF